MLTFFYLVKKEEAGTAQTSIQYCQDNPPQIAASTANNEDMGWVSMAEGCNTKGIDESMDWALYVCQSDTLQQNKNGGNSLNEPISAYLVPR